MSENTSAPVESDQPQCQHFVVRKKRLCRMTVRPGRAYCGEHEPKPTTTAGEDDTRIPCPYDSKHTCYASKLERHLALCNARPSPPPPHIERGVNAPAGPRCARTPLPLVPAHVLQTVVEKVHRIYDEHIRDAIASFPELPIHAAVLPEFGEPGRTEASLKHLRQASSLLHVVEAEGLVDDNTCYIELGAGKGQLSLFVWRAWCEPEPPAGAGSGGANGSGVLLVDRAALRHKRDAKMRAEAPPNDTGCVSGAWCRVRADLSDVRLRRLEAAQRRHCVGLAKHLCGVATDYALRALVAGEGARGVVLATCCHHRCLLEHYTAATHLQELGLSLEELNVMLGVVSWATCGDGRARGAGRGQADADASRVSQEQRQPSEDGGSPWRLEAGRRRETGRRAKAVLDWGRVLFLRAQGYSARLALFVPDAVSPENLCIIATK